jgi:hypothetical protein
LFGGFNGFNCRYYLSVFVFNDKFNPQQQAQLQDLQAKLEDDIGFIEQIDIDEMSELVGDLQADTHF